MTIRVSKSLYSREALLKTAYSLTDRAYLHLEQDEENWIVSWKPRAGQEADAGEFENELIAQALRESLISQTAEIRKMILARAFASTVMDDQRGDPLPGMPEKEEADDPEADDPEADGPLTEEEKRGILRGWFDGQ